MTTLRSLLLPLLAPGIVAAAACGGDARDTAASDTIAMVPDSLATDTGWVASATGLGGVRTGMRRADLLAVIGQPSRAGYYTHDQCTHVGGTSLPPGVQIMMIDDTVARIDVEEPGVRTREGAQVGDTEASVLARYRGRVAVTPHAYTGPQGHYLTVTPPGDTLHRIIFETDGAVVKNYRVGRRPQVEWVEGCS